MEYEISDEDVLFDDSTNPSLKQRHRQSVDNQEPAPAPKRSAQKAELIPEEEQQAA